MDLAGDLRPADHFAHPVLRVRIAKRVHVDAVDVVAPAVDAHGEVATLARKTKEAFATGGVLPVLTDTAAGALLRLPSDTTSVAE